VNHELLVAALDVLRRELPLAGGLLALSLVLVAAEGRLLARLPRQDLARRVLLALAIALGVYLAWSVVFLCDDAFISFRYARNLARGQGLTWNPGEWVEGYTNFLWTALLAGFGYLGASIPHVALFGDLVALAVALVATGAAVRRIAPGPAVVPFAALALAGTRAFYTFGTSGLETMPVAALVAVAVWASTTRRGPLLSGAALTAALMTRPDQFLLVASFGVALVAEDLVHGEGALLRRLQPRRYLAFAAPFLLVYLPYFLVRWHVYGDPFPNTYYVRSAGQAYWHQGLFYGLHFLVTTGAFLWLPVFLFMVAGRVTTRDDTRLRVLAVLALPVFAEYVMRVGGDFMEHRFFVPVLPVAAIALEVSVRRRLQEPGTSLARGGLAGLAALAFAAALVPVELFGPFEKRWNLAAEPSFYRVSKLSPLHVDSPYFDDGERIRAALTDRGVRVPIACDSIGLLGWTTDLPVIDAFGLTNKLIGKKPVEHRGRPGHEKFGTNAELVQLGAVLYNGDIWGPPWTDLTRVSVAGHDMHLLHWDPAWMERLRGLPDVHVPDVVGMARVAAAGAPRERVLETSTFLAGLLGDALPEAQAALRERLGSVAEFEGAAPAGARTTGDGLRVESSSVPGSSGAGLLSSLPDAGSRVGRMEIPIPALDGDELRFALAGTCSACSVRLVVDGQEVAKAVPTSHGRLVPASFPVAAVRGRPATLIVDDADPAPRAGLMVDAVHLAPRPGDVRTRLHDPLPERVTLAELLREAERELPAGDPDLVRLEDALEVRFTLDELPEGAAVEGVAFGKGPVRGPVEHQSPVSGAQGAGFLDSFHGGDGSRGRVTLPWFTVPREPVLVMVGGGSRCERTYVGLEVDGKIIARACGREDEVLRPALLTTRGSAGQRGRVVIVDDDDGPWGHVLADDVMVVRSPALAGEP
jgi:hypothetical protein